MDNYDYPFTRRRDRGMDPTLKIVLVILAVPVAIYFGDILYTQYVFNQVGQAATQFTKGLQEQSERAQLHMVQVEQERTRQKQLELDFQREQIDKQAAEQESARTKEAAWNKFYKRPAKCDDTSKQQVLVECGNFFIKEKNRFEGMWANNQLRN